MCTNLVCEITEICLLSQIHVKPVEVEKQL